MALESRPASYGETAENSPSWLRMDQSSTLFWLIPFAIAGGYMIVFLAQLPHNLWIIDWSSDYASGFTVPTTIVATGTGGHTLLGTSGAWVPLWFGLLTARLPLHRYLWELAPTGLFVITAAAVAWSVAQVASRREALLAALLILVASPRALYIFMAPVAHNTVYPGTALLGVYLLWLVKGKHRRARTLWMVALAVGVVLGTFISSDELLIVTGVVPFVITATIAGARWDRRARTIATSALGSVLIAVPVARLTASIMKSAGYLTIAPSTELAPLSALPRHAELMLEGLRALTGGYLREATSSAPGSLLGLACEVALGLGLAVLLIVGVIATAQLIAAAARRKERSTAELARALHVIYWAGSAGATSVAWALSIRIEYVHESYYATLLFSVAAVVVLLAASRSPTRWLISLGASLFFAAGIVGLAGHYMENYIMPIARSYQLRSFVPSTASHEHQILAFAKAHNAIVGYAGYGDAASLTWTSNERVLVRPVQLCNAPQGVSICPFFVERVPSWYVPRQRHTFLLVDEDEVFLNGRPEGLGNPIAAAKFGPIQMYIYPYDLAGRMAPASD